jgi:sulfotransferase
LTAPWWLAHIELLEQVLGCAPKILVPMRPVVNVLASFEKLYRETVKVRQPPGEAENYFDFQTVEGRCRHWLRGSSPVGLAVNRVRDAMQRGHGPKLHVVGFNELTTDPEKKMRQVYEFLGEPHFPHDFDHVEQVTREDDEVHGFVNLHKIRPRVQPAINDAHAVLGTELATRLSAEK